jgi:rhamnogalacturonyl hydrolase YesR
VTDLTNLPPNPAFERTDFLLTSYEWGVTYAGMLHVAEMTGDGRFKDYTAARLSAVAAVAARLRTQPAPADEPTGPQRMFALRSVLAPRSLDDSGAMCTAMIKASRAGVHADELRPWIDNYMGWISTRQFRLPDGTLARNRPLHNALWLDDLYMSVPALAQMAMLTGEAKYFDDAVKQILQFSSRMFVKEKGLYLHGWIQEMDPHPAFHWGRANGWAVVAMAELLSVLPTEHPGRAAVLAQFRAHVRGLAACQGKTGLWSQLLDRPDSYLETSASAMFTYAIARGINRGWLDELAYGPMVSLAWNAVAQQVNAQGQVENTCVGTGMGFDPAFYCYRPVNVFAAHGYGPVLLAGAEMIVLRQGKGAQANVNDGSAQFAPSPALH